MRSHPRHKPRHAESDAEQPVPAQEDAPETQVVPPAPYATPALMRVHRQAYRDYITAGGTPMMIDTPGEPHA
jgi:hypothetical protein